MGVAYNGRANWPGQLWAARAGRGPRKRTAGPGPGRPWKRTAGPGPGPGPGPAVNSIERWTVDPIRFSLDWVYICLLFVVALPVQLKFTSPYSSWYGITFVEHIPVNTDLCRLSFVIETILIQTVSLEPIHTLSLRYCISRSFMLVLASSAHLQIPY